MSFPILLFNNCSLMINGKKDSIRKGDFIIIYINQCVTMTIVRPELGTKVYFVQPNRNSDDKIYLGNTLGSAIRILDFFLTLTGHQLEIVEQTNNIVKLKIV